MTPASLTSAAPFSAPIWRSAFRPFFLLGIGYGVLFMLAWLGAQLGLALPAGAAFNAWHGHEIVFGFAGAVITGIVLTALPSWAGTEEIDGRRLALLAALWVAGRVAIWLAPWLPSLLVTLLDVALFPAVAVMVAPQLLRLKNRLYLLLLPVLAGLFAANLAFHLGAGGFGLRLAIYSIMLLYVLKGGVLVPVFTGNALRDKKRGPPIAPWFALDVASAGSIVILAAADLGGLPTAWIGFSAAFACVIQIVRLVRWRGWLLMDVPLVFAMHLGHAWLVVALGLKAAAHFAGAVPESAWLHAFTVGALGMMMMGLMTRVVLVHTGRPALLPPAIAAAIALMGLAALVRVAAPLSGFERSLLAASAALWIVPFVIYLAAFAAMCIKPSLPRKGA